MNALNVSLILQWLFNFTKISASLQHIDLSNHQILGPIRSAFKNLHSFSYLDLSSNKFEGLVLLSFLKLKLPEYLDVSHNNFTISNI